MTDLDPIGEAELITAAVADFQERNPGAEVARVEVIDLKEIEARGFSCDRCGATVEAAFFLRLCDDCLDQVGRRS